MENVMTNGFAELSLVEMGTIDGGYTDINFGEIGYGFGKGWCDFWMNVGGCAYDFFH